MRPGLRVFPIVSDERFCATPLRAEGFHGAVLTVSFVEFVADWCLKVGFLSLDELDD
jgi:hypothetical protein